MLISPAAYVIRKIGGLTKTATALGIPVTTVQGWRDRKSIPQKHWMPLIEAASEEGEALELSDFLEDHEIDDEEEYVTIPAPKEGVTA